MSIIFLLVTVLGLYLFFLIQVSNLGYLLLKKFEIYFLFFQADLNVTHRFASFTQQIQVS